ncbi:PstS family phosphate ABC transporter substrate-binding protein [Iningainema sp. BLCCT55]|uniref:Phosphate-binding protein n=2 Tax=Iningainema TaxID=1932705 RepID=A0A8J6XUV1_9CYAN|nr:PstS family phosphate ABC transporter substrate-binding protein [Iningainema tapete BLCC-T55]
MIFQNMRTASVLPLVALMGITACNNRQPYQATEFPQALTVAENASNVSNLSGNLIIDGSSTVFPVSKAMAQEFKMKNPGVQFTVAVSGTGGGFEKFCTNQTDITGASRPINSLEQQVCQKNNIEYIEMPVAFDGISVVANQQNNFVDCLKIDELRKMWEPGAQGKVSSWNQIRSSFPNQPLKLYGPDPKSGTYDYFTLAVVGEEGKSRGDYTKSEDDTALVKGVSGDRNGLGFFGYAYYIANRDKLKLVAVDNGYGCTKPSPTTISDSSYQPLSRPVFIYVKKSAANRPEVKAFTNFYVAPENANIVLQVGYVPLPNITLNSVSSRFRRGITGSVFGGSGSVIGVGQKAIQEKESN